MSAGKSTPWAAIPDAAQRLGFNLFRLHLIVYGYMGFIAGIASLVQAQLAQSVAPTVLVGKELDVLAAVVLGGASLFGGVGTVLGTLLGLTLLAIMQNGLVLLGVSSYWSQFFTGLVILVSVSLTALSYARANRHRKLRAGMSGEAPPIEAPPRRRLAISGTNTGLGALLVALVIVFTLIIGENFFSTESLRSMAFQLPELGILSLAMMITLLAGGINLAIIATANLCALTMAYILNSFVPGTEGIMWVAWQVVAVLAGFAVAAVIGVINGTVIAYLGVSPILATLGTMTMVKGISIGLTRGTVLSGFPDPIVFIANGLVFGIPFSLFVFFACAIPMAVMLNRTPLGNAIYMLGSNLEATRFSGVRTRRVTMKIYVLSSLLAGAAAVVMMSRFNSANASYGESYLLVTILAAVLGGIDPFGGFGKVSGLVLSLIILQVISSAFNLIGLSQFLTLAIWGALLIATSVVALFYRTQIRR